MSFCDFWHYAKWACVWAVGIVCLVIVGTCIWEVQTITTNLDIIILEVAWLICVCLIFIFSALMEDVE